MSDLRRFEYGDPAKVYEQREARTCKGCIHLDHWTMGGKKIDLCTKGKKAGKRCKFYREAK